MHDLSEDTPAVGVDRIGDRQPGRDLGVGVQYRGARVGLPDEAGLDSFRVVDDEGVQGGRLVDFDGQGMTAGDVEGAAAEKIGDTPPRRT
ncbi:hypothetical protein GCM10009525_29970 [Streptosporangium amethystogenes subsp. fukuiense]